MTWLIFLHRIHMIMHDLSINVTFEGRVCKEKNLL